jgi:hypothetical protein
MLNEVKDQSPQQFIDSKSAGRDVYVGLPGVDQDMDCYWLSAPVIPSRHPRKLKAGSPNL